LDHLVAEVVELQFVDENVRIDGCRSTQTAATLIEVEDRVEARSVPIEEVLAPRRVKVSSTPYRITEEGVRVPFERRTSRVETHSADVDHEPIVLISVVVVVVAAAVRSTSGFATAFTVVLRVLVVTVAGSDHLSVGGVDELAVFVQSVGASV